MDSPPRVRAQGALEYLLLIGGAVLLATIVMILLFSGLIPQGNTIIQNSIAVSNQNIINSSGIGSPVPLPTGVFLVGDSANYLLFDNASPTGSLRLTQLVSPIQSFNFPASSLWRVEFQNTITQNISLVDSASIGVPIMVMGSNPTQFIWDNVEVEPGSGAFAQVRLLVSRSGSDFEFRTRVQLPAGYDIKSIHFPELQFSPLGTGSDDYFITSWQGGQRIENPYVNLSIPTTTGSPGSNALGMFAVYDEPTRRGLYWSLQDGTGHTKAISIGSNGAEFAWGAEHFAPIPTPSTYETPYPLLLSAFAGNWYDAAQKYRSWALTHPMASRGKWATSPLVSSKAKNARALLLLASQQSNSDYTSYIAEIDSAVQHFGTDQLLVHWYSWHQHPFDNDWPDHVEKSTFAPAVNQVRTTHPNLTILPYYFAGSWDVELGMSNNISYPTPPNVTSYPYTPAIAAMACAQEDGTPRVRGPGTNGWTLVSLDPSFPSARAVESQVALDLIASSNVNGLYLDAYSGADAQLCFNDPSSSGHPKNGGNYWTQKKRQLVEELRDTARGQVSDFIITSENLDEHLIPSLDVMSMYPLYFTNNGLQGFFPVPIFSAIYHDYIPLMTIEGLDPTSANPDPFGQLSLRVIMANYYHFGLMPVFSNWQLPNLFLFDTTAATYNSNLLPQLSFSTNLVDSYAFTQSYVRFGQMLRPVAGTWQDTLQLTPTDINEPSVSVWRASNGKVGVILINPTISAASLNASLLLSDYGFAAGQSVPVVIRATSNTTPIANGVVSDTLNLATYSVGSFEVMLLELG